MISDTVHDKVRVALYKATDRINDEETAELCFGIGLVVTDHIFNLWHWLAR